MSKSFVTPFCIGGAVGAAVLMLLSLSLGWVVTSGLANAHAVETAHAAVKKELVPICMHQFHAAENSVATLASMEKLQPWERENYVNTNGWAAMPGSASVTSGVARECAEQLFKPAS
ncbi:MAG: hypothetical protein ACKVKG_07160 [Alphaproteobacteria bacterium]